MITCAAIALLGCSSSDAGTPAADASNEIADAGNEPDVSAADVATDDTSDVSVFDLPPPCAAGFVGDDAAALDIVPGVVIDGQLVDLADGDPIPLVRPLQGGRVSFVVARAKNILPCRVQVTATLRSRTTGYIAGAEGRTIDFLIAGDDGWQRPDVTDTANAANLPLCPDYDTESIDRVEYDLEVKLLDKLGRVATATRRVVPTCQQLDVSDLAACRCECAGGYTLGRCANPIDGGWLTPDAADATVDQASSD